MSDTNTVQTSSDPSISIAPPYEEPEEQIIEQITKSLASMDTNVNPTERSLAVELGSSGLVELGNARSMMGRVLHQVLDTRVGSETTEHVPDGLWVDTEFPQHIAMEGQEMMDWKRPWEIADNPVLFAEGTTRFDVGQGGAGTCWFLCILAGLSDKEELLKQVIVEDYHIGTEKYNGKFHCRFWRFGEWIDVYVDDHIPVWPRTRQPWGSRSKSNPNEMWVSLVEKAFAKFHGSYLKIDGGSPGEAFANLTGGVSRAVKHEEVTQEELFSMVTKALRSGCLIAGSVPRKHHEIQGLVGGHAYTLTASTTVNSFGVEKMLFRIRNPWGGSKGEWNGAWSDNSTEWRTVDESVKERLQVRGKPDGECWIELMDFMKYFDETYLCNFTPDFDEDGSQDSLNTYSIAFGEWVGSRAVGRSFPEKFNNPRFVFTVPSRGPERDGTLPVVIQFAQERKHRRDRQLAYISADFYKIEAEFDETQRCTVLFEMSNNTTYYGNPSTLYRYRCTPGQYLIIPSTYNSNMERDFMLRIFSSQALTIKTQENTLYFLSSLDMPKALSLSSPHLCKLDHYHGEWSGSNSGGQIRYDTFANNPQYAITIRGSTSRVMLSLKQQISESDALGIKLYRSDGETGPLSYKYTWKYYNDRSVNTTEGRGIFIITHDAHGVFALSPGQYTAILFLNKPQVLKKYILTIGYSSTTDISVQQYNTVNHAASLAE